MSAIETVPVSGTASFLSFCRLPRLLYAGMPGFSPSLDAERWTLYAHRLNPHFQQVTSKAWLARRGGKAVGRIAAQFYHPAITPVGASRAQFGSLDAIDDREVVAALIETAETWLRDRGAAIIHGPFSPSVNSETGLLIEGFDAVPMLFMPWHPPYLGTLLEGCGYSKARDLVSYRYLPPQSARDSGVASRPEWRERLRIRPLRLQDIRGEAAVLTDIFNDAWRGNWGFVPLTVDELVSTADALKYLMPEDFGFVVEMDGAPAAFGIVIPNLHEITRDLRGRLFPFNFARLLARVRKRHFKTGRLALFGVRRQYQRSAAGGAIILACIDELRRLNRIHNLEQVEFGWILEDNIGMRRPIEMVGAKVDKVHRVYEKQLVTAASSTNGAGASGNSTALARGLV
jgi:hypothetical protein